MTNNNEAATGEREIAALCFAYTLETDPVRRRALREELARLRALGIACERARQRIDELYRAIGGGVF